ncbi:MAG: iron-sulfur cluster assembly scaffold protein [Planctomycetota bacterium]|jgi:NifU-like protein involved in Fe-S cluster formation
MADAPTIHDLSPAAAARLRAPQRRGTFRDLDAARAQLGLLTVADGAGQARIYWLIDLNTQVIEDARFLAFGHLGSHPLTDLWMERCRGTSIDAACAITAAELEASLRAAADQPALAGCDLAFIADLQERARAALPAVQILPKPVEVERYARKREQDWDDHDRSWLPLSLMKKIMAVQDSAGRALSTRLGHSDIAWSVEGLHDDFHVVVSFATDGDGFIVPTDDRATVALFMQEALRSDLHPGLTVAEKDAEEEAES